MKADGPNTVVFELTGGNADFPYTVSDYHMPIMPKNPDGTVDWQSGIRTGANKLDKFDPGVQASFTKNENYYKPGKGWFDTVQFLSIKDAALHRLLRTTPPDAEIAYQHAVASELLLEREAAKRKVGQDGVTVIDVEADALSLAAVNKYLEIKSRGAL